MGNIPKKEELIKILTKAGLNPVGKSQEELVTMFKELNSKSEKKEKVEKALTAKEAKEGFVAIKVKQTHKMNIGGKRVTISADSKYHKVPRHIYNILRQRTNIILEAITNPKSVEKMD